MKSDSTKLLNDILNGKDLNIWTNLEILTNLLLIGMFIIFIFCQLLQEQVQEILY